MDFRQRLENMAMPSGMYATRARPFFPMQVLVLLEVVGVDTAVGSPAGDLMRLGVTNGTPSNVIPIRAPGDANRRAGRSSGERGCGSGARALCRRGRVASC